MPSEFPVCPTGFLHRPRAAVHGEAKASTTRSRPQAAYPAPAWEQSRALDKRRLVSLYLIKLKVQLDSSGDLKWFRSSEDRPLTRRVFLCLLESSLRNSKLTRRPSSPKLWRTRSSLS